MSIIKVNPSDIESFSIVTNPIRYYSSSSSGVTGSVHVFARRSSREKEMTPLPAFLDTTHSDSDLNNYISQLATAGRLARYYASTEPAHTASQNALFADMVKVYLDKVDAQGTSARKFKAVNVIRFTPSVNFNSNTVRKLIVKDILTKYYRTSYPSAHWAYSNYNTLNFFTSSTMPTSSVLLYPNVDAPASQQHDGYVSGTYSLSGAFSFDFYINPRYQPDSPDGHFKAGTIFHLSSSYALSLVSGSSKDFNGRTNGYRLLLQLSHSADTTPSQAVHGNFPNDLVFMSDDNSLWWNRWHHVVVRWGTNLINDGSGSFNIDGVNAGTFVVPSGTVAPRVYDPASLAPPEVLCVGNFWEGKNHLTSSMATFFALDPATREGLEVLYADPGIDEPAPSGGTRYAFNHPLNAELHDLSIKRYYMTDIDIAASASRGPKSLDDSIAFYLPPFFTEESPFRQSVNGTGGVLQTPFFEVDGTTAHPFNVAMSFGVNGHYINLENYLRDFASNVYPRAHHMSGTAIDYTTNAIPANEFLYNDPWVRRRNMFVLPCDDGLFLPSYELLASESMRAKMVGDDGVEDLSYVNLNDMLSTSSLLFNTAFDSVEGAAAQSAHDFVNESIGFTPEKPGTPPGRAFVNHQRTVSKAIASGTYTAGLEEGAPLTIYQRTRDPSSNQVTFFDVSNLYYGKRILPGTLVLSDNDFSSSGGAIGITLKDDGWGNVYRADCLTSASSWNSCGNVFYDEGIIVVKNPHLYFFGKNGFEVSFRGEQNVHALKLEVVAPQNMLNSSSNPTYLPLSASGIKTDTDPHYVYITGLNFHDENLNVVAKTQLAQPIVKRHGDRVMFKVTFDV